MAKPFVKWAGGKTTSLETLTARMPDYYDRYFENFTGGGALFLSLEKREGAKYYLNDVNRELVTTYRAIRDTPDLVIDALASMQKDYDELGSEFYYSLRALDRDYDNLITDMKPSARGARMIALIKLCYNGLWRENRRGQMNTPYGKNDKKILCDKQTIMAASKQLQGVKVFCRDFERAPAGCIRPGNFFYLDPPYIPLENKKSFTKYSGDDFTIEDHEELRAMCDRIDRAGAKFMMSNSYCPASLEMFDGYNIEVLEVPRFINSNAKGRDPVKEILVRNY